ncbi:hypothetical protein QYF36_024008 [Acer negundo]|nr:hypothetical protein QYF36_024008 [Acer negundo]
MYSPRRRIKLMLTLLPFSAIVLFLFFSASTTLKTTKPPHIHVSKHLQIAHSTCEGTLYPDLCVSTIASLPDLASKSVPQLISVTVNRTVSELRASTTNCTGIRKQRGDLDKLEKMALNDCLELFNESIAELKSALSDLSSKKSPARHYHDLQTLFSAAMTNQYTCLDGFAYSKGNVRESIKNSMYNISRHVSNSLVMLKKIPGVVNKSTKSEVFPGYGPVKRGFPSWLTSKSRKLLQTSVNETKFDLIVAKDGTGNYTTITEAVEAAPNSSTTRFVIYIKAGAYFENVEVVRKKTMLTFIGDGIGKTIVKASRNVVDGWTTFRSATVAVVGDKFIAKGITFENSAGPSKHQAVALRSGSDFSAFYQCSFVGYQDTLYVHSLRQFYRECDIYVILDELKNNSFKDAYVCNSWNHSQHASKAEAP